MSNSELFATAGADNNPLFMQLLENAPDAIIIANKSGRILLANAQASVLFGYPKEELLNQELELLLPERMRGDHVNRRQGFSANASVRPMGSGLDIVGRRKDGSEVPLDIKLSPLHTGGELLITAVIRDITERKAFERQLQENNKLLKEKNFELEQFASIASHDLQEPLRKILAFGDRLKQRHASLLPDEGREYIGRMLSAAERMSRLINDLLQYSRLMTRATPMLKRDLNEVVRGVLADLEIRIEKDNARVTAGLLPQIVCDPSQMRQLFQNLIGNALKFHGTEPTQIRIESTIVSHNGAGSVLPRQELEIKVIDNGIGFDEKYAERIFHVFERLHGQSQYEGTGIGLAVCKRIVERHNGTIRASSSPGNGATFTVTFPFSEPSLKEFQ